MTAAGPLDAVGAAFGSRVGRVAAFDERVGAGTVHDQEGRTWYFHCTRIADGSRAIAVGEPVAFDVEPGPTGLEAVALRPPAPSVVAGLLGA